MTRVLIVDDSPTARDLIGEILSGDQQLEVIGFANDGAEAVEKTAKLRPDVITMDIQMPRMDGFEATTEIMIETPTPIVILSASTMIHEVEPAMRALRAGALTLMLKPPSPSVKDFDKIAREIVETVKAMAGVKVVRRSRRHTAKPAPMPAPPETSTASRAGIRAVAIAASTGGPPALNDLLGRLPADFGAPILLVQHIADGFVEGFVAWLNSVVALSVKLAQNGELIKPGKVYVAPQDCHLGVSRGGVIYLSKAEPIGGFRPAATYLFESVAKAFDNNVVATILTGMGSDGVDGLKSIHKGGGTILAQNKESCTVFGMPHAAIEAGIVNSVLAIDGIAKQLVDIVH